MRLLAVDRDSKTRKGRRYRFVTGILYLIAHKGSGRGNVCKHASAGCAENCLLTAGRGVMQSVREGRQRKTDLFFDDCPRFMDDMSWDIHALERKASREDMTPCVRPNGTSDLLWERIRDRDGLTLMERFPHVQFYDYTKYPNRDTGYANYHLTFSLSETNGVQALLELRRGRNVAVVFDRRKGQPLPAQWFGHTVVDGDESDLRFLDASPDGRAVVVGLRAKGKAKHDDTGFVQIGG